MVSSVKLHILKKDEYILWTMKMEPYLAHTDYALWEVILNGNSTVQLIKDEAESTSRTNELDVAYSVSTATCHSSLALGGHAFYEGQTIYKKTRRKLKFNRKEPVGFDKTKVECFNCYRKGYFARDCGSVRNSRNRSRDARNAGYIGRDNGKWPAKDEDEKALFNEKEVLHVKEKEITETVFDNRSSDEENSLANDRFKKGKGTGYRESRPVWNNVQRINHQNKFAPIAVFTRSGRIPVSAAKPKDTASISVAKPVNTVGHPHQALKNKGIVDSGCSRHMIGNKPYLADYQEINDGGFVAFGSSKEAGADCHLFNIN
nr:ribonuclease H-like domain-containing protein [Tanacetum cinerariifolium]